MITTPYVTLSSTISLDGYLDTAAPPRLMLSNDADFDRVDELRAQNDAIMVGANTVRRDNPRLLVRSIRRRSWRESAGLTCSPWKVTVTASGDLDPRAAFFADDNATKLVYCPSAQVTRIQARLGTAAIVIGLGGQITMGELISDLSDRGVHRLMVEGGGTILTQFLAADLADELQLAMAPFFVGDSSAPRFVGDAAFPWTSDRRAALAETRTIGDIVLLRYALSARFRQGTGDAHRPASALRPLVMGMS
ncbi:RibD family protein [Rathayibacter soli]|uniref:RibD family protein n=1 Tax=Rathayibacter soli TaxID=3144168 RepID=UPI0027E50431|nr:dihydrofolate reductase family protein [Glaciibacter superstes]